MGRSLAAASVFLVSIAATPIAASAYQAQQDDPNRVICRSERFTGSRIASRRVCRTAAEWASQSRVVRNALDNQANRPVEGTPDSAPTLGGSTNSPFIPPRS